MASSRLERIGTIVTRVEGLLLRGGIKPDDRPLWYDVYKAFPPLVEPKYARPKPDIKPIKPILYHEDVIRAKFHSNGYGMGAVNMLSPTGESHTKRLLKQYEKLKREGVLESELVEKSAAAVEIERQDYTKLKNTRAPEATSQSQITEHLKDIFNEK
ncbi:hypothetical protein ACJJTC_013008 [Scirpophaga incertulas]